MQLRNLKLRESRRSPPFLLFVRDQYAGDGILVLGHLVNDDTDCIRLHVQALDHSLRHVSYELSLLIHCSSFEEIHLNDGHWYWSSLN